MSAAVDITGRSQGVRLERAEYVGPHGDRRVVLEFDPARAASAQTPWRVRAYILKPHATSPHGYTWKLARRRYHRRSVAAALSELRPWLTGTDYRRLVRPRVHRRNANDPDAPV